MFEQRGGRVPQGLRVSLLSFFFLSAGGFAVADTLVSGAISTNTTWTLANSPYVMTGYVFVQGASNPVLTIQPGVTMKANAGAAFRCRPVAENSFQLRDGSGGRAAARSEY